MQNGVTKQEEISGNRRKRDARTFADKYRDFCSNYSSSLFLLGIVLFLTLILGFIFSLPFASEFILISYLLGPRKYFKISKRAFDFPYRVPKMANVMDGSYPNAKLAQGITYLGNERNNKLPIYLTDSDLRSHLLVLGTTGSGKTEFLISLVANALAQNTGLLYIDGKGDSKLPKDVFRLARITGREDDILLINFITSGRDFIDKQEDKITNNINIMSNASSGMLIETIVGLMDDAGGSGNDMWKGRAIAFIAALTRPLCYLRDKGFLWLSAEIYIHYFELHNLEELIYDPQQLFGSSLDLKEFGQVNGALRSYILNLPGYNPNLYTQKKRQDQKTLEQHGYITMQLTRVFNDLTYTYAHIFKAAVGDIDIYDVVLNRRILLTLLPSSERSPDSLQMLGKLILGNIKQMIAGCLGNRVEGLVRAIIDSRPTNANVPFYIILDEYGYYSVKGFANLAAQSRSAGFSITFSAQDFASLQRTNEQEADSTWENTNLRAVGRITSGIESNTWKRISGAAGSAYIANQASFDRETGILNDKLFTPNSLGISRSDRLDYDDLASQENGEFTYIVGKKGKSGEEESVRVMRGMGFYVTSDQPKAMRINDFIPVLYPEKNEIVSVKDVLNKIIEKMESNSIANLLTNSTFCKNSAPLNAIMAMFEHMNNSESTIRRPDQSLPILFWLSKKFDQPAEFGLSRDNLFKSIDEIDTVKLKEIEDLFKTAIKEATTKNIDLNNINSGSYQSDTLDIALEEEEIILEEIDTKPISDNGEDSTKLISDDPVDDPYENINESIENTDIIDYAAEDINELYFILKDIQLFKSNNNKDNVINECNDLVTSEQIKTIHLLTQSNSEKLDPKELNETCANELNIIQNTIDKETFYKIPENIPDSNTIEAKKIIEETIEITKKLKLETIRNIKKIQENNN